MNKKIIIYIIIIIVILVAVFFSQRVSSNVLGKTLASTATTQAGAYMAKQAGMIASNIYSKMAGNLKSGEATIQNVIDQGQKNISGDISGAKNKIENYFSGIANSVEGKNINSNTSCQVPPSQTQICK